MNMTNPQLLAVKLVKSMIGAKPVHCKCVKGLGLRKIGQTVILKADPCIRGMINKAIHLLSVSAVDEKAVRIKNES
jgi:large subunit ribosomal protein L30